MSVNGELLSQASVISPAASDASQVHLELVDLFNDFDQLLSLLRHQLELAVNPATLDARGHTLDAFLLAAGMSQIVEDFLHREPPLLDAVQSRLRHSRLPALPGGLAAVSRGAWTLRVIQNRQVLAWHHEFAQ